MKEFIEYLVKKLVDSPDDVELHSETTDDIDVFYLKVAKSDMGKIIGTQGRNANALRTIINAYAKKNRQRVKFRIVDEEKDQQH